MLRRRRCQLLTITFVLPWNPRPHRHHFRNTPLQLRSIWRILLARSEMTNKLCLNRTRKALDVVSVLWCETISVVSVLSLGTCGGSEVRGGGPLCSMAIASCCCKVDFAQGPSLQISIPLPEHFSYYLYCLIVFSFAYYHSRPFHVKTP